jgi:hypothetical protein
MQRFRLNSATMVVYSPDGFKGQAVVLPAGSEVVPVDPVEARPEIDRSKLVAVGWDGKTVRMFLLDLLERGERVDGVGER